MVYSLDHVLVDVFDRLFTIDTDELILVLAYDCDNELSIL